jgi:hypothetical protein
VMNEKRFKVVVMIVNGYVVRKIKLKVGVVVVMVKMMVMKEVKRKEPLLRVVFFFFLF